jgi:hypothetical protein
MGADAELFLFDFEQYETDVVPRFLRFLLDGHAEGWFLTLSEEFGPFTDLTSGTDLLRHCTYLNKDFSIAKPPEDMETLGRQIHWSDQGQAWSGAERACRSSTCPENWRCPFHRNQPQPEDLNYFFVGCVGRRCLGQSQFVGRSMSALHYGEILSKLGVAEKSSIRELLSLLGTRGFVVGYRFSNGDGIHGWLNPAETQTLATELNTLDLPRYKTSFEAMANFSSQGNYDHPGIPFTHLSLSFIRTVALLAVQQQKGILWGNDIAGQVVR